MRTLLRAANQMKMSISCCLKVVSVFRDFTDLDDCIITLYHSSAEAECLYFSQQLGKCGKEGNILRCFPEAMVYMQCKAQAMVRHISLV